jgi:hypothetical protein
VARKRPSPMAEVPMVASTMPLKPGSKAPQKIKSLIVRQVAALFKKAEEWELMLLRGLLMAELCARDALGSALYQDSLRNQCVVAIDRSDLRCRLATTHGLVTMADYTRHKAPDDPTASWIVRAIGGGSWPTALNVAGIGVDRYLEPILVRGAGARTRPGGVEAWSLKERVVCLAGAIERNFGYDLTREAWERYRDLVDFETPDYSTLCGIRYANKKKVAGLTLAEMHELACRLILREPKRFPKSADRLQLVAAVRAKETTSKTTDSRKPKAA